MILYLGFNVFGIFPLLLFPRFSSLIPSFLPSMPCFDQIKWAKPWFAWLSGQISLCEAIPFTFCFLSHTNTHTLVNTGEKKQAVPVQVNEFDIDSLVEKEISWKQSILGQIQNSCAIFCAQIVSTNCVQHRLCGCICMLHDLLIPLLNRSLKRVQINYAISGRNSFLLNFPFFLFSINKEKSKFPVVVVEITKAQVLIKQSQKMITVLHIDAEMWLIILKC